jgi:hypothetical protein
VADDLDMLVSAFAMEFSSVSLVFLQIGDTGGREFRHVAKITRSSEPALDSEASIEY